MTAWALYMVGVSVLLAGAARAAEGALTLYGRPVRFVWLLALAGSIAAPFAFAPAGVEESPAAAVVDISMISPEMVPELFEPSRVPLLDRLRAPAAVDRAVGRVWAVSAVLATLVLVGWFLVIGRAPRRWPVRRLEGEDVHLSPRAGPAVFGLVRPSIVVPHWLLDCPVEVRRLALAHEREHVDACDPALLAAGAMLAALTPWNPVSWWLFGRLRAAVELDCDRRVLRRGANVHAYGSMLLGIAGRGRSPLPAVALVEPAVLLERRIRAMTGGTTSARRTRTLLLSGVCVLAVVAACSLEGPTEPLPVDESEVAAEATALVEKRDLALPGYKQPLHERLGKVRLFLRGIETREGEPGRATLELLLPSSELGAEPDERVIRARAVVEQLLEAQARSKIEAELVLREREVRLDTLIEVGEVVVAPFELRAKEIEVREQRVGRIVRRDRTPGETERRLLLSKLSPSSEGPVPLMLIDGLPATPAMKEALDPQRIERVEVLKGAAAERTYGEAGKHGVIRIRTK